MWIFFRSCEKEKNSCIIYHSNTFFPCFFPIKSALMSLDNLNTYINFTYKYRFKSLCTCRVPHICPHLSNVLMIRHNNNINIQTPRGIYSKKMKSKLSTYLNSSTTASHNDCCSPMFLDLKKKTKKNFSLIVTRG